MDEVITLDLGYFLRYITAYLDTDAAIYFSADGSEVYTPVVLDGKYRILGKTNLTRLLRVINSTFFKAYGGWRVGLYFNPCGIFTGEVSFTPADTLQQLPTPGDSIEPKYNERGHWSMTEIIAAMTDAFSLVGKIVTEITGQPVLLFFLAASLIPVGIGIFRKLKKAAK